VKSFDSNAICPKCGYKEIKVSYMGKVDWVNCSDSLRTYNGKQVDKEHLRRMCLRCYFNWPEDIIKETKINNSLINRMPFRIEGSLEGGPDIIIVDCNGKEIGDLYTTREEAEEIINILNSCKGN
jgi:hypothetical protein